MLRDLRADLSTVALTKVAAKHLGAVTSSRSVSYHTPGISDHTHAKALIDALRVLCYDTREPGRSSVWLERAVRDREVGSSNLPAPTYRRYDLPALQATGAAAFRLPT
jgi:hypothetical protein